MLVWMLTPSLVVATGWPARETRSSTIVRWLHDVAPTPPRGSPRSVARCPTRRTPPRSRPSPRPPIPGRRPRRRCRRRSTRVRPSTVEVEGEACGPHPGRQWLGRGARPRRHERARRRGERATHVITIDGATCRPRSWPSTRTPTSRCSRYPTWSRPRCRWRHPGRHGRRGLRTSPRRSAHGDPGAHRAEHRRRRHRHLPHVELAPARARARDLAATGRFGRRARRPAGTVVGVAFATDPGQAHTGYALTSDEVRAVLATAGSTPSPPAPASSTDAPRSISVPGETLVPYMRRRAPEAAFFSRTSTDGRERPPRAPGVSAARGGPVHGRAAMTTSITTRMPRRALGAQHVRTTGGGHLGP